MFNVIYQWLIVWVNVLAYKLDSLTETIWGYCDEGCKHAQISVGSLWITLSGWHESQCQVTAIHAESYAGGIRAAGRLLLEGLDAGLLMGEQEKREQAGV